MLIVQTHRLPDTEFVKREGRPIFIALPNLLTWHVDQSIGYISLL